MVNFFTLNNLTFKLYFLGHGVILTDIDKIGKYVNMLIRQSPIESRFQTKILDNLNAEIAKGFIVNK